MSDFVKEIKDRYNSGDITVKIIFICVGVFITTLLFNFFFQKSGWNLSHLFGTPAGFGGLIKQPWGILTYVLFHGGILHLLMNMVFIYYVGQMFLRYFRTPDFLTFFTGGAIAGALAFMAFSQTLGYHQVLIGASAAIYAVFFGLVAYKPQMKITLMFFNYNIRLDYIAYALLAIDLYIILSQGSNTGGHISHLGGAAFGFLYMKQFEKGNDFIGRAFQSLFQKKSKLKVERNTYKAPPRDDYEFNAQKIEKQKKIDKILDKISKSGYASLSKEEKDFLFKEGKNG